MEYIEAGRCSTVSIPSGTSFDPNMGSLGGFPYNRIAFFTGNIASDLMHLRTDGQAATNPAALINTPGFAYLLRDVITPIPLQFKDMQDSANIRLFHTAASAILVTIMLLRVLER